MSKNPALSRMAVSTRRSRVLLIDGTGDSSSHSGSVKCADLHIGSVNSLLSGFFIIPAVKSFFRSQLLFVARFPFLSDITV